MIGRHTIKPGVLPEHFEDENVFGITIKSGFLLEVIFRIVQASFLFDNLRVARWILGYAF